MDREFRQGLVGQFFCSMWHQQKLLSIIQLEGAFQVALVVKNPPADAGDMRPRFEPELGRSPGEGHSNPLQYKNPMDRGTWWATVHSVTKSQTQLKQLSTHAHIQLEGEIVCVCREVHAYFFCQSCHKSEELEG